MTRSLWTAAPLLATLALAGDAAALNTLAYNSPSGRSSVPILSPLGTVGFVDALIPGEPSSEGCGYWLSWRTPLSHVPFGGNQICRVIEINPLGPGCPALATMNFPAAVVSVPERCGAYDMAGTPYAYNPVLGGTAGVTLVLTETLVRTTGALSGVVIYPNATVMPVTL